MNNRGLVLGAAAFAAAIVAERFVASMASDLARYEKMRAMSGEPSIAKTLLAAIGGFVGDRGREQKDAATGILGALTHDIVRYAKMRGM
jgi:hypothetical protein